MSYNYYVLATTTIVGGVLQLTFRRYEKFSPELETQGKKSKRKAISKFLAKNGLIAGVGLGVTTLFFKEGFIFFKGKLFSGNSEVIVVSKSKSFRQLATSKDAILSLISGAFVGSIWVFRS